MQYHKNCDFNPASSIDLHSRPFQCPHHKVLVFRLFHVSVAVSVTQFHPHINVFFWRVVAFATQSAVCFIEQLGHLVSCDCVRGPVCVFCEQAASYVHVVLRRCSVLAFRLCHHRRLIVLLARQVFLGLADTWIPLRVSIRIGSAWVRAFAELVEIYLRCTKGWTSIIVA